MNTRNKNRRYYLHQITKRHGFRYSSRQMTVWVRPDQQSSIPSCVKELRDTYGYNIQLELV